MDMKSKEGCGIGKNSFGNYVLPNLIPPSNLIHKMTILSGNTNVSHHWMCHMQLGKYVFVLFSSTCLKPMV